MQIHFLCSPLISLFNYVFLLILCGFSLCIIRVNGSLGCVSSRLGNCRSRYFTKFSLSIFQDWYNNGNSCYSNYTVPDLFQLFCSKVLFHLLQAYCISIPFLKFELSVTYNYSHDLSTKFILN